VTARVHLVRHAKAKNRAGWTEPDELRPLTKRGRREAMALGERLRDEGVARLVASPFLRCVQTLEPLAEMLDLPIETTDVLAEGAEGGRALELLLSLGRAESVAACTHGDVVADVVHTASSAGVTMDRPFDAPVASTWVLEIDDGRVVGSSFVERPLR